MTREPEPEPEAQRDAAIQRRSRGRKVRCIDGRLMRHDPQPDDPDLETDIGQCEVCEGNGCVTCSRCGVILGSRDEAEGCEDFDCGMRP